VTVQELHLVGFTTDLRNLVFSRQRGVKSGGFMVIIDERLRRTLEEVARLEEEGRFGEAPRADSRVEVAPEVAPVERPARASAGHGSRLTPKEIQIELRAGKTVQEVARMAGCEISWVERFVSPILAERQGIIEAVKAATISRPRAGRSGATVWQSILANLRDRKVRPDEESLDEGWKAVKRGGVWEVAFRYAGKGQTKEAQFAFDPETRMVRGLNPMATEIAWRPPQVAPLKSQALAPPEPPVPAGDGARLDGREEGSSRRNFWGSPQPVLPSAPARRSRIGGNDGPQAAPPAGRQTPRPLRQPVKLAAQPQSSARQQASQGRQPVSQGRQAPKADPKPPPTPPARPSMRLRLDADEDQWKSAVVKSRATKTGNRPPQPPPVPPPNRPRPTKKPLPDDWLLQD
jgi:hypothetical protein